MQPDTKRHRLFLLALGIGIMVFMPTAGWAHGVVGKRWFPTTVQVDDPFVSDELSLKTSHIKGEDARETELEFDITKRLSPNFAIGFGGSYQIKNSINLEEPNAYGFSNPVIDLSYQFIRDPAHEVASTVSLDISPGGVGAKRVGAASETTLTPNLKIGKGFGDLPDWADWLKPLAVTSAVGFNLFTGQSETENLQNSLEWGVTIMYSVPYLQSFVRDVGLRWPFNRLFPIVEFNGETQLSGPQSGQTTAFANPGLIWAGKYFELAVEAQIPLNDLSGHHVGVVGLIHFFLDDIAPKIFTWTPFHGVLGPQSLPQ